MAAVNSYLSTIFLGVCECECQKNRSVVKATVSVSGKQPGVLEAARYVRKVTHDLGPTYTYATVQFLLEHTFKHTDFAIV